MNLRRRLWPWLLGIPIAIGLVVYGIWRWRVGMDRAEYERRYPVANAPGEADAIARAFARWEARAVIAAIGAPPAIASVHLGTAPCDASLDGALEFAAGEADQAKSSLVYLFEAAKRGRYMDELEHARTLRQIANPILVIAIAESVAPEIIAGSEQKYAGGYQAGAAYLYDIDGSLRCAGTFEAESSDVVEFRRWKSNDPRINEDPELAAKRAIRGDLDSKMHAAAIAGLHRVVP